MKRARDIALGILKLPLALVLVPLVFLDEWLDDRGRRGPKGWRCR